MGDQRQYAEQAIRWGTDYLLKAAAHIDNQILYVQVGNPHEEHQLWERPEDMDSLNRPVYKVTAQERGSEVAAETAAALAAASIVFRKSNLSYSTELLITAKKVFLTAGEQDFEPFKIHGDNYVCAIYHGRHTAGGLYYEQGSSNLQYVTTSTFLLLNYAKYLKRGGQTASCGTAGVLTADQLIEYARKQVDYILGENPARMSYMVGYGVNYPKHVHHRGSSLPSVKDHPAFIGSDFDALNSPNPNPNLLVGAVVGGPDEGNRMRLSSACLNPKLSKRRGRELRNRDKNAGEVTATKTVRSDSESPIVMSARKTTMAAGVAIDNNTEIVGEEGSEITVKCVSGKEYRRMCREDILASKTNVKANCYCNVLSGVEKLRRTLSESELEALGKTPFGHLLDVGNLKWVNGQLLILLALNYVEPIEPDSDAISFHIRDRVIWAFETFPGLEKREVCEMIESRRGQWPRALRWAAPTLTNHIVLEEVIFSNDKFEWIGMKAVALEIGKENVKCLFLNTPMIKGDGSLKVLQVCVQGANARSLEGPPSNEHCGQEEGGILAEGKNTFHWGVACDNGGEARSTKHVGKKRKPNVRNPSQGKKGKKRTCGKKGDDNARKGVNEELLEKVTKLEEMVTGLVAANVLDRKLLVSLRGKVKGMQRAHERHAVLMERCLKKCGLIRRRKKGIKKSRQHAEDGPSFVLGIEHGGNEDSVADQEEGSEDNVNLGASDYEIENPTQLNDMDDTINSVDTEILLERRAVMVRNIVRDNGGSVGDYSAEETVRVENHVEKIASEDMRSGDSNVPIAILAEKEGKKAGEQRKRAKRRADVIESKSVCDDELCLGPFTKEPMELPEVGVLERVDTFMHKGLLKKPKNPGRRFTATDEKLSADAIMALDDEEDTLSKTWYYNLYFPDGCLSNLTKLRNFCDENGRAADDGERSD
ncbi:unnamed protein product [Cuscuta campestris]|uniref:Endoglucanase n=1 Tax=Cuscuta campestris TaxID=132261 RepID=A0A484NDF4_9ASTE|nr:unnamed protein product [Cuscuta campestris]